MTEGLAARLEAVRASVADAAREADRTTSEITTIVVTKFHSADLVRQLAGLGVRDVGENRHQEARDKAAELADLCLDWHFIGQLQSKKARQVRSYASSVHSLDRASVVAALASEGPTIDGFIQVNLTDDPSRGGVQPHALDALVDTVLAADGIRLRGLMVVAPLGEPARPAFARMRVLSERVAASAPDATALSMGMSGDYREAILEGATHLRIGAAITGNREPHG